jgi:hypothetical protein
MAGRRYVPGADHGVATLLTATSWLLGRLPGAVTEERRRDLIQTLRGGAISWSKSNARRRRWCGCATASG